MSGRFPQRFGDYVLLHPLGSGGMGRVFLALAGKQGLETLCVIKRMLPGLAESPEAVRRFQHEADLARRLVHGNLVHTHAIGSVDGEVFLVQEYVEGEDVMSVLEKLASQGRRLPVEVSIHIAASVARGLEYAHNFGKLDLVHRDINPPNVRVTYDGEVKLLDFGIAASNLQGDDALRNKPLGKLVYMAPEQLRGEAVDRRADLHAVGVLLWELLTGYPLGTRLDGDQVTLPHDERDQIVARTLKPQYGPPSTFNRQVTPEIDAAVMTLLATDPADRFSNAAEVRAALARQLPPGFNAESALATEVARLTSSELERAEREQLIQEARALPPAPRAAAGSPRRRLTFVAGLAAALTLVTVTSVVVANFKADRSSSRAIEATALRSVPHQTPVTGAPPLPAAPVPGAPPRESEAPKPEPRTVVRTAPASSAGATARSSSPTVGRVPAGADRERDANLALAAARAAFDEREWSSALEHARRAVPQGGAEAYQMLGAIYFKLDRYDEAVNAYEKASRLAPGDDSIRKRLDFVRQSKARMSAGASQERGFERP